MDLFISVISFFMSARLPLFLLFQSCWHYTMLTLYYNTVSNAILTALKRRAYKKVMRVVHQAL